MNYNEPSQPSLVEPGVKYFLRETLKNCHTYKEKYKNQLFNLSIFLGFVFIVGAILMYKYKGKPTTEEINQKDTEKKQYVLSSTNFRKILPYQTEVFKYKAKFIRKVINLVTIS